MLTKAMAIVDLPPSVRNAKIKLALRNLYSGYLYRVFKVLGYWLNKGESRFILEFRPDSHFDFNQFEDYQPLIQGWLAGNRGNNVADLARFYALCLNVSQILGDGVSGDFVELGVYRGNSASILTRFARRHNRRVFLFDTFEGFDRRDFRGVDEKRRLDFTDTSLAEVQKLVGTEGVVYVQGFFPESAGKIAMPDQIAVAHIDCDLYEPMKAGLEWFYPRLSPGGIMILHDYSSGHWPGIKQAVDEFFTSLSDKPVLLPDKSGTAIVRKATF